MTAEHEDVVRPVALYRQIAEYLAHQIHSGLLQPGGALPSETQLMGRHGVSRPTVRAAIAELRYQGLVETRQGSGTFVRPRSESPGADGHDRSDAPAPTTTDPACESISG